MADQKINPITDHDLVLMPPTAQQKELFGWIRLANGTADAGYIYLHSGPPADPHLSFDKSYIVTNMPMASLATLLDILQQQKELAIAYHDPQISGVSPSVFIVSKTAALNLAASRLGLNPEMSAVAENLLQAQAGSSST